MQQEEPYLQELHTRPTHNLSFPTISGIAPHTPTYATAQHQPFATLVSEETFFSRWLRSIWRQLFRWHVKTKMFQTPNPFAPHQICRCLDACISSQPNLVLSGCLLSMDVGFCGRSGRPGSTTLQSRYLSCCNGERHARGNLFEQQLVIQA